MRSGGAIPPPARAERHLRRLVGPLRPCCSRLSSVPKAGRSDHAVAAKSRDACATYTHTHTFLTISNAASRRWCFATERAQDSTSSGGEKGRERRKGWKATGGGREGRRPAVEQRRDHHAPRRDAAVGQWPALATGWSGGEGEGGEGRGRKQHPRKRNAAGAATNSHIARAVTGKKREGRSKVG